MSEQVWIDIPSNLLSAASELLDPKRPGFPDEDTSPVNRDLVQALIDYFSPDLGCDHATNICCCDTAVVVQELHLALKGRRTCQACAGDGMLWSKERAVAEADRITKQYGVEALAYDDESLGYYDCPACFKKGWTPL